MSEGDALQRVIVVGAGLQRLGRVLVVGGGFVASAVASTAQAMGCNVTLLVPENAPLRARLGAYSDAISTMHRRNGVEVMTHARVTAVSASGESLVVTLADGWQCQADSVVLCPGDEAVDVLTRHHPALFASIRRRLSLISAFTPLQGAPA